MIDRCRAVLRAFAGLELVAVGWEDDALELRFGPGGTRVLTSVTCDLEVGDTRFERRTGGPFGPGERDAALDAARSLVGRRVAWLRHRADSRLIVAFEDGARLRFAGAWTPHDWSLWHDAADAVLEAFVALDAHDPRPERTLKVFGAGDGGRGAVWETFGGLGRCDGARDGDGAAAWTARPAAEIGATPPPPRAWLAALTGLPLRRASVERIPALAFGGHQDAAEAVLSLELARAGLEVRAARGARAWRVLEPDGAGDPEATVAALAPLIGQRPACVEHHEDGRLELAFGGGALVTVLPVAQEDPLWTAVDGATRQQVHAGWDDGLAPTGAREPARAAIARVWGALGRVERAPDPRPARAVVRSRRAAEATPRAIHPCSWVLGALVGKQLIQVDRVPGTRKVRLSLFPTGTVVADTCDMVVDDGRGTRTRLHRTDTMGLSDTDAAIAAALALRGETVAGVAHDGGHRLTLAFSGGGEVVLSPGAFWDHDWRLVHVATGATLDGGRDGRLRLRGTRARAQTLRGTLGSVTATTGDRALLRAPWIADATMMLRALAGLEVCLYDPLTLGLEEPGAPGGMLVQNVWADLWVHAPGEREARRIADNDADGIRDAFARLDGVRLREARHAASGLLRLRFADGHRITLAPSRVDLPLWTAYYGSEHPSPRVDALPGGALRARGLDGEPSAAKVYGSLGPLPAYGFKS